MQDDQSLPSSTPASSSRDPLEHEGKVESASCTSAAASTAGSATSDGPEHLESGHWRFEAPNLILDTEAGKVLAHLVPDPDNVIVYLQSQMPMSDSLCSPMEYNDTKSLFVFTIASASIICFCIAICHLLLRLPSALCRYLPMVGGHPCVPANKQSQFCMFGHSQLKCPDVRSRCGGVRWTLQRWRGHAVSGPCCWPSCSAGTLLRTPPVTSKPSCSQLSRYFSTHTCCLGL